MEYFFYVNKTWYNLVNPEPYIVKRYRNNTVAKVVFDDLRYDSFIKDFKIAELIDKYGHKMSVRFCRKEPWVEWLFEQKKG